MSVFLIAAMLVTLPGEAAPEKKLRGQKSLDLNYKWTGDFDGTVKDRAIRVLVAYSKTFCFLDRGRQRDRPRNGSIRQQYLQILHRLPAGVCPNGKERTTPKSKDRFRTTIE
jgi:hypothetical protein